MKVRLVENGTGTIPVSSMKDGEIAVIRSWKHDTAYNGKIVQRFRDILVSIGQPEGNSWSGLFREPMHDCRVELLKSGATIVLE